MRLSKTGLVLTTFCSLLLSSCGEPQKVVTALPIPADRIDCVPASARPELPAEHQIDWTHLKTMAETRAEHDLFVKSVRAREQVVARYLVSVEGLLFACANDAAWLRDYQAEMDKRTK